MRTFGSQERPTVNRKTEKIRFTTHHPVTNAVLYGIEMDVVEAKLAIEWLKEHNGYAPDMVKALIAGFEIAFNLQWEEPA
jgi:hypothetical protein